MNFDRKKFVDLLCEAWPSRAGFDNEVLKPLNKSWEMTAGGANLLDGMYEVIEIAIGRGWFMPFVRRVKEMRDENLPLVAQCDAILPAAAVADPYESRRLLLDKMMVNRKELRDFVRKLDGYNNSRVLQIHGPKDSGKSYSLEFLYFLKEVTDSFDVHGIDLEEFVGTKVQDFASELIGKVPDTKLDVTGLEMNARFTKLAAERIAKATTLAKRTRWFVFDNFDRALITNDIRNLIYELARWANTEHRVYLRVALLDCAQRTAGEELALNFYKNSEKDAIDHPTVHHVYDYMRHELEGNKIEFDPNDLLSAVQNMFSASMKNAVLDVKELYTRISEKLRELRGVK